MTTLVYNLDECYIQTYICKKKTQKTTTTANIYKKPTYVLRTCSHTHKHTYVIVDRLWLYAGNQEHQQNRIKQKQKMAKIKFKRNECIGRAADVDYFTGNVLNGERLFQEKWSDILSA